MLRSAFGLPERTLIGYSALFLLAERAFGVSGLGIRLLTRWASSRLRATKTLRCVNVPPVARSLARSVVLD